MSARLAALLFLVAPVLAGCAMDVPSNGGDADVATQVSAATVVCPDIAAELAGCADCHEEAETADALYAEINRCRPGATWGRLAYLYLWTHPDHGDAPGPLSMRLEECFCEPGAGEDERRCVPLGGQWEPLPSCTP